MSQIKIIIYSIIVIIFLSSVGIAIYYNNKFKNFQLKQQTVINESQQNGIIEHKIEQDTLTNNLEKLNNKHIQDKKQLQNKFKDIETSPDKSNLYNEQFVQILNEIEVISGNKNSSN